MREKRVTSIKINNKKDYKRGVEKKKEWTKEREKTFCKKRCCIKWLRKEWI